MPWRVTWQTETAPAMIAARFHAGLARAFTTPARKLVETGRAQAVALSGGCFQNAILLQFCLQDLSGLPVLIHHQTPANDGGLAFGQALVAAARDAAGSVTLTQVMDKARDHA